MSGVFALGLALVILVAPVSIQAEEAKDQEVVRTVVSVLEGLDIEPEVIARVEAALLSAETKEVDKEDEDEEEEEEESPGRGRSGQLPPQASDRAHQVQRCLEFGRMLRQGDSGEEVEQLQEFLLKEGYFDHPRATGYFGPVTEKAVQEFQAAEGVVNDGTPETTGFGLVGPRTRGVLTQVTCLQADELPEELMDRDDEEEDDEEENGNGDDSDEDDETENGDSDDSDEDEDDDDSDDDSDDSDED